MNTLAVYFKTLDTNEALRKATHGIKIMAGLDFPENQDELKEVLMAKANDTRVPPPIVISATVGKENAQFLSIPFMNFSKMLKVLILNLKAIWK